MNRILKTIFFSALVWMLGIPANAQQGEYQGIDLTIQSVFGIITGLACWFTRFALVLMVVMIVFYGIKFMTSQGNPTKFEEAKKSFTWALVGVLVILGTYTIILTVADFVGGTAASSALSRFLPLNCSGF